MSFGRHDEGAKIVTTVVDAHQHFWDPGMADYPWMIGEYEPLRAPHGPSELAPLLEATGVSGTVVVQARQELDETVALLETAAGTEWVLGVVGWVDLTSPAVPETIDEIVNGPDGSRLVGIRHLVHDEPDPDWLIREDVMRGLAAVAGAGLTYDLLVRTRELPAAIEVAEKLPELRLVVDHLAKPPISTHQVEPWAAALGQIASLPNVTCKVSGLVTEADWSSWTAADLAPYIAAAVDLFGVDRLMWGSDWPVCTLSASYSRVRDVIVGILSGLVGDHLDRVLGGCAIETYRLDL